MLKRLQVQSYALIESLDMEFFPGLNIITGETGAGKSILLGALGLIRGDRADVSVIQAGASQCVVEAEYDVRGLELQSFFAAEDLEYHEEVLVRRQVQANGKSRAFINDTPVNLTQLRAFSERVMDIHSQHANLLLQDAPFQVGVLDGFGEHVDLFAGYQQLYTAWQRAHGELESFEEALRRGEAERDYREHQYRELQSARLSCGEMERLEGRHRELANADRLREGYGVALSALRDEGGGGVLARMQRGLSALQRVGEIDKKGQALAERLESARIEIDDIAGEIEALHGEWDLDPAELERITDRLNQLHRLEHKHAVHGEAELIALRDRLGRELEGTQEREAELAKLRKQEQQLREELLAKGRELHTRRETAAPGLAERVRNLLISLGIERAQFAVNVASREDPGPLGMDRVEFLFNANAQGELQPLSKVASGGELSRVMLSLKSIMARVADLPTIIFDEIDTGVSGAVASRMGAILHAMGGRMQVINITHLPQIAARGEHHYLVYKEHGEEVSRTNVRLLASQERVLELAKMLSGAEVTDVALANARVLLGQHDG